MTLLELEDLLAGALQAGWLSRDPAAQRRTRCHRPFYIVGEVSRPGQFPYVYCLHVFRPSPSRAASHAEQASRT